MNKRSVTSKDANYELVRGIKRKTRKQYSAEENFSHNLITQILNQLRNTRSKLPCFRSKTFCGTWALLIPYEGQSHYVPLPQTKENMIKQEIDLNYFAR